MTYKSDDVCAESLFGRLGYEFQDLEILETALTHKSYHNENKETVHFDNERLEFLGDSVLGLILSAHLMKRFPNESEGILSKRRAALVNEETLREVALALGLETRLRLGRGEQHTSGGSKPRLLASTFEAILGAVYLDGGLVPASTLIERLFEEKIVDASSEIYFERDYKTRLQEMMQKSVGEPPHYSLISAEGPEHKKTFEVELRLKSKVISIGRGKSKKQAEQDAARQAMEVWTHDITK